MAMSHANGISKGNQNDFGPFLESNLRSHFVDSPFEFRGTPWPRDPIGVVFGFPMCARPYKPLRGIMFSFHEHSRSHFEDASDRWPTATSNAANAKHLRRRSVTTLHSHRIILRRPGHLAALSYTGMLSHVGARQRALHPFDGYRHLALQR